LANDKNKTYIAIPSVKIYFTYVKKLEIDFYFTEPYCSWQKGCNENSNGLLREFYPKKTNISKIETEELIRI